MEIPKWDKTCGGKYISANLFFCTAAAWRLVVVAILLSIWHAVLQLRVRD